MTDQHAAELMPATVREWTDILARVRFGKVKVAGKTLTGATIKGVAARLASYADDVPVQWARVMRTKWSGGRALTISPQHRRLRQDQSRRGGGGRIGGSEWKREQQKESGDFHAYLGRGATILALPGHE